MTLCNTVRQRPKDGNGEVAGIIIVKYTCTVVNNKILFFFSVPISDNLRFGLQFSRKFVDGSEPIRPDNFKTTKQKRSWSNRLKMNLHNNEVGRQVCNNIDYSTHHRLSTPMDKMEI